MVRQCLCLCLRPWSCHEGKSISPLPLTIRMLFALVGIQMRMHSELRLLSAMCPSAVQNSKHQAIEDLQPWNLECGFRDAGQALHVRSPTVGHKAR